jgi:REP element-mobilizing transposase RayT
MGVNGGDYNAVFKWLVEQVNSTDSNSKDMHNKENLDQHSLQHALNNFNDSEYTFDFEDTKSFIQSNVIDKIKELDVKLKCIEITKNSYILEYPSKTSGKSLLDRFKTISKKEIWKKIKNLNTKKLYAALSINIKCIQNKNYLCISDDPLNHSVTITSSRDTNMTIKNSWGIEYGNFGKFNIANGIKKFSIGYIDIVDPEVGDLETVVDPHLIESQNAGKKYHRTKSRKNKGKKRKVKKSKKHKNISTK